MRLPVIRDTLVAHRLDVQAVRIEHEGRVTAMIEHDLPPFASNDYRTGDAR
jgi:hypothetical protein